MGESGTVAVGLIFDGQRRGLVSHAYDTDAELSKLSGCDIVRCNNHLAPKGYYQRHLQDEEVFYVFLGNDRRKIIEREGW